MNDNDRTAAFKLIETGSLVNFDIVNTAIDESPGQDESVVRIDILLGEVEEDQGDLEEGEEPYRSEDHEWGGLGFMFCLASLSFHDARPRGVSDMHFIEDDEFTVADFLDGLRYVRGKLQYSGDYVRGRCLKTDITVRLDGSATLATRCRGEAAVRWVQRLKGKNVLEAVPRS